MNIDFIHEEPQSGNGLPPGWFNKSDINTYKKLILKIPDRGTMAEIGVWQGRSLCSIANIIIQKSLRVYAIDNFKGSKSAADIVHDCDGNLRQVFKNNISSHGLSDNIKIIEGDSQAIPIKIRRLFDLVFIDADHSPKSVCADIRTWQSKIKNGGIIAGHDYKWVKDVVHKELNDNTINKDGNIWWVTKK